MPLPVVTVNEPLEPLMHVAEANAQFGRPGRTKSPLMLTRELPTHDGSEIVEMLRNEKPELNCFAVVRSSQPLSRPLQSRCAG